MLHVPLGSDDGQACHAGHTAMYWALVDVA